MPYLILGVAALLALYGLTRFILAADARQVVALFLAALMLALTVALFLLAVTGRLPAAIGILVALWPLATGLWMRRKRLKDASAPGQAAPPPAPLSRGEALQVLGLPPDADENAIRAAHRTLIAKLHPDHDGSGWLAARINQARDILLKNS